MSQKKKNLGLYIHIPFCEKKCDYCNFVSFCKSADDKLAYLDALCKEIGMQGVKHGDYFVDTIYIGGGTPSCLPAGAVSKILNAVFKNFFVARDAEISIECNPNSLTYAKLQEYRLSKVNRISIGLQAYNDKLLKKIGRLHTKRQFDDAVKRAKSIGFKNLSADIILGLPGQKLSSVKRELFHLAKLGINHISAYGLIVENGTKLCADIKDGRCKLPSEELQVKMYDYTKNFLQKHGIFRYEVSNFAREGFECKHNKKYWCGDEYLGLGLNASSFVNNCRFKNTSNLELYEKSINLGKIELDEYEQIDTNSQIEEHIMLSLRTSAGINLNEFASQFGYDIKTAKKNQIEKLVKDGLLKCCDGRLFCTDVGFKFLNQVILQLVD